MDNHAVLHSSYTKYYNKLIYLIIVLKVNLKNTKKRILNEVKRKSNIKYTIICFMIFNNLSLLVLALYAIDTN